MISSKKINIIFFTSIIVLPFAVFAIVHWIDNNCTPLPYYGDDKTIASKDGKHFTVPSFKFINQDEEVLTDAFIENKIWVADYFFTSCTSICPKLATNLQKVQDTFKNDDKVKLISFTVDPERDIPAMLKSYAAIYHSDSSKWQFVTGEKKDLYAFARKGLFIIATDGDGGAGDFIHSENLVLIDAHKHIRGYYNGTDDADVTRMIKDIQRLENEK